MDNMIPAGKIAALRTGEMVGMIAQGEENDTEEYKTSAINGKINLDMKAIKTEEQNYVPMPDYYSFVDKRGIDRKEENPSILILASDPRTQDINSALYSAVLNRTLRLVNSKHNLPGGIIADEFPTIYIHKIDNVVATARSNRVAVLLGLQELPQLRQFYKKEVSASMTGLA